MKQILSSQVQLVATFLIGLFAISVQSAQLVDDRAITIHSTRELAAKRRALIQYLWGAAGFPEHRLPNVVVTNVTTPVKQL
ncbi:MAG TPA: hypothetical protein VFA77_12240, partial [Candidatus Eisenbacteria bacterium]|nr:hypothetical protein [Candidatus Eisenbacteria bacterium]